MLSEKKYNELRAFVHKIPYFRITVLHPFRLVKRLPLVPYYLIAIPFVVLLRVLRFYVVIRFAQPDFSTFGHALFPELYLCERDLGLQERKGIIDVFYTVEPPANKVLFRKFQEHIRLYPQSRLLAAIDAVNRWIHGYQDHIIYIKSLNWRPDFFKRKPVSVTYGLSESRQLLTKIGSHIIFNPEEELCGKNTIRRIGIDEGMQFICFHARDSAYKDMINPYRDWRYHDFRDANVQNYLPMAEKLVKKGYSMVRMGAEVIEPLTTTNPRIIDYAVKYRTELMDIYLTANCRFFVTSFTGMVLVAALFRKPVVFVNCTQLFAYASWTEHDLFIPKRMWLRDEKRFLTLREMYEDKISNYHRSEDFEHDGIEFVENSPEEITDAVFEMEARLAGKWQVTAEEIDLQCRFRETFKDCTLQYDFQPRIGLKFIQNNLELLD